MRVTGVTESPIEASVDLSEFSKGKGVAGFKGFVVNDLGIGGFIVAVVGSGGGVSVGHLSGWSR